MKDFGCLISKLRRDRRMSQEEFGRLIGCTKQTVSNYERNTRKPDYETLEAIADVLNVPMSLFLSEEEQKEKLNRIYRTYGIDVPQPLPANLMPVQRVQIPMLGGIAAGEPVYADQQYGAYVEADAALDCTYALRVDGDSMEPTVHYGDVVFIRQQEDVDDGRIAAVLIDDSATLKRVFHIPNGLQLLSDNAAKYPPRTVTFAEHDTIRILGLAVAFKRSL